MVADSPDGKVARPHVLMNSPRGIRYKVRDRMLEARRHEGGEQHSEELPLVVLAPMDSHTPRQTSTLHSMPRKRARSDDKSTLASASPTATAATEPPPTGNWPDKNTNTAVPNAPTMLAA
jgi:hypothetical protein